MRKSKQKVLDHKHLEDVASSFTRWVGSPSSILVHTVFFAACFLTLAFGVNLETMLLFLTTVVSLEAVYLAILIQFTVNKANEELLNVGQDIDEIQEDIDEIQEDVDEMQEDVGEIQKDIDEIQEDVDDIEEGETEEEKRDKDMKATVDRIQSALELLMKEVNSIKTKNQ